ncbi:MAG: hypothetical protein H0T79_01255 [Deltaproteobacteria bacterium]|nr:hypothetical protein [Deltaproteobacteria bacterium]
MEWGFVFRDGRKVTAIRVTDEPFVVAGSDDHQLIGLIAGLTRIEDLIHLLEQRADVKFDRRTVEVQTNLRSASATPVVRAWLSSF